ncbi:uncharacterized protein LOC125039546 isoform X2 [Penaeus chinensis]|uniref:uncharacterized protein LOC125039546 isoform X2 n=1 Tax=Penaeus chinensis TaxID=139456 RepID=UPI001FB60112|nr:uncharacterized protein LOC125039546 isoform X2 [Penaeus chinensis]
MKLGIPFFCVLGAALGTAGALYIEPGCIVQSQWEVPLLWPDTYVSVWIPPGESFTAFDLEVTLKGHDVRLTSDKISLTSDEVSLSKKREFADEPNSVSHHPFQQTAGEGWRDYRFSLKDYAITSFADNKTIWLNNSRGYDPVQIKVTGSNVTVNCFSAVRVWNVTGTPAIVPLGGGSEHFLSVFSVHEIRPTLTLGREELSLSQKGLMAVDAPDPLPAFEEQNLTLTFHNSSSNFVTCYVKLGGKINTSIAVPNDLRRKFTVKSSGKQFYLLVHQSPSSSSDLLVSSHKDGDGDAVVALSVLSAVAVLGLMGLLFYLWTLKPSLLLAAVAEDNIPQVRALLSDVGSLDNALVEAHLLRRADVIPILREKSLLTDNDVIKMVLREYRRREDEIMAAAKSGRYRLEVDQLLRRYELPATLRDTEGKTILHHAASAKDASGAPLWTADNIRSFLTNHTCFVNAVDYQGRTCLHLLAQAAVISTHDITWNGRDVKVTEAWLKMANLLVTHGCHPSSDFSGEFPHELAKQNGHHKLATYLEQAYQQSANVSRDASLFRELVTAVQENNVSEIRNLLLRRAHLLPLGARQDPLTEAVRRGHLEAATMLLSAGAPLCGRPLVSITPLETAHSKADLQGLLPAILRKEYVNKLKHEASTVKGGEPETYLQENVEKLAAQLEDVGPKATWEFTRVYGNKTDRSRKARELLCAAAGLGLPLTCQLFGLEDVHLHPLPREANPVYSALKGNKQETLYVLFRDLHMSLSVGSDTKLPEGFHAELLHNEIENFKKKCKKMKEFAGKSADSQIEELDKSLKGLLKENISKNMMLIISRYGFVLLLQKLREHVSFNRVIDDLTGFTMLHISALYGTLAMVEYLLFNGANIACKSKDGFTAEEVAATKGNRECMEYLEFYRLHESNSANKTSDNDFANRLADGYKVQVKDFSTLLLPEEFGMKILSESQESTMVKLLLQKKMQDLAISGNDSFRQFIKGWMIEPQSKNVIEEEVKNILREVAKKPNSKFEGKSIQRHSETIPEGNFPCDSMQIYWQVDSELYKDFQIRHSDNDPSACSIGISLNGGAKSPCLNRFKEEFYEEIRETLLTYKFKTPNIWLTYPCIYMMFIGVTIYLLWQDDKGRTRLVRVLIVPVLKTEYPDDISPPPLANECLQQGASVYVTSTGEGRQWTYVMTQLEEMILSQLSEEKKLVLLACKFLEAILNPCWWFPREQSRRHGRTWRSYAVSLSGFADIRQLLTLFLEEVSETRDEQWKPSMFLERVLSVYQRATRRDEVRANIKIFLDPKHSAFTPSDRVLSVTDFLNTLHTASTPTSM